MRISFARPFIYDINPPKISGKHDVTESLPSRRRRLRGRRAGRVRVIGQPRRRAGSYGGSRPFACAGLKIYQLLGTRSTHDVLQARDADRQHQKKKTNRARATAVGSDATMNPKDSGEPSKNAHSTWQQPRITTFVSAYSKSTLLRRKKPNRQRLCCLAPVG